MAGSTEIGDTEAVTREILQFVSEEISTEWKALGRCLDVKDPKLNHIQADNSLSQQEQVYQMLLSWTQAKGTAATYGILFKALNKVGRGALIEKIKELRAKAAKEKKLQQKSHDRVSSSTVN